jgi:DNA-binding MarR family transcriptional regulator
MNTETFQEAVEAIKPIKKKKKNVASTSVAAFEETAGARVTEKQQIIAIIETHPGSTREQIAEGTGLKLQSVTGNVTLLVRNRLIEERGTTLNRSGRKVRKLWPASERP